jgi:uncharacterized protein YcfJ
MTSATTETTTRAVAAGEALRDAGGHFGRKLIAVLVCVALTGCQTMPTTSGTNAAPANLTPEEAKMAEAAKAYNTTVTQGCVTGAVAGALIGALLDRGNRGRGAAIGALAGGALGCGSGMWLAKAQQQNALSEQQLDGMTAEVRNKNALVSTYVSNGKTQIAADKAKIARIDKDLAAGRISMDEARTEIGQIDRRRQQMEAQIAKFRADKTEYEQTLQVARRQSNSAGVQQADAEVARMEKQVSALESDLDKLIKRRQLSRVG